VDHGLGVVKRVDERREDEQVLRNVGEGWKGLQLEGELGDEKDGLG